MFTCVLALKGVSWREFVGGEGFWEGWVVGEVEGFCDGVGLREPRGVVGG